MFLFVRLNEQLGKFAKSITQATRYLGEGEGWFMKTYAFYSSRVEFTLGARPKEVASESQGMPDGSGGIYAGEETEGPCRVTAWDGHAGAASSWQ